MSLKKDGNELNCAALCQRAPRTRFLIVDFSNRKLVPIICIWDVEKFLACHSSPHSNAAEHAPPLNRFWQESCPRFPWTLPRHCRQSRISRKNFTPRPCWAYSEVSKYVQFPGKNHMLAAEYVLSYLRGTWNQTIRYCRDFHEIPNVLWGWVDADWAADTDSDTRRSRNTFWLWMAAPSLRLGRVCTKITCHFPPLRLNLSQLAKQTKKRSICVKHW